jgi:TRAP-type transport system periplasmic protein
LLYLWLKMTKSGIQLGHQNRKVRRAKLVGGAAMCAAEILSGYVVVDKRPLRPYSAPRLDAIQAGEPGKEIFNAIGQKGVVPIAWGENGFRELTNSKRSIRMPDDLRNLTIRVPPIPILAETFQALGAKPVSMNFDQALIAFQQGKVDGQENPIGLIIPYKLWAVHNYITLWRYAIDPLILGVSGKTWAMLSVEDRNIVQQVGTMMMELQKDEARDAPVKPAKLLQLLQDMYGMEVVRPNSVELDAFRRQTHSVYDKWAREIGMDLVGNAERILDRGR